MEGWGRWPSPSSLEGAETTGQQLLSQLRCTAPVGLSEEGVPLVTTSSIQSLPNSLNFRS